MLVAAFHIIFADAVKVFCIIDHQATCFGDVQILLNCLAKRFYDLSLIYGIIKCLRLWKIFTHCSFVLGAGS